MACPSAPGVAEGVTCAMEQLLFEQLNTALCILCKRLPERKTVPNRRLPSPVPTSILAKGLNAAVPRL